MRERSGTAVGLGALSRPGGRCRGSPSPPCPDGGRSGAGVTEAAAEVPVSLKNTLPSLFALPEWKHTTVCLSQRTLPSDFCLPPWIHLPSRPV